MKARLKDISEIETGIYNEGQKIRTLEEECERASRECGELRKSNYERTKKLEDIETREEIYNLFNE